MSHRDYHQEYIRRNGTGHEKNRESYLEYQREYCKVNMDKLRVRARERMRKWRARKVRQAGFINEWWRIAEQIEHEKISAELRMSVAAVRSPAPSSVVRSLRFHAR
jgi:hypothetical protein